MRRAEQTLEELRQKWSEGDFQALIEAFRWCALNGWVMPDWLHDAVLDELIYSYESRPRGGKYERAAAVKDLSDYKHQRRHALVEHHLKWGRLDFEQGLRDTPMSEAEAAREAEKQIDPKDRAWARWETILKSYNLLEKGRK